MADDALNMSVVDIYDIAASIGKDFELLIDNYGTEAVTELMPKVITVLEQLEALVTKNEKGNSELAELNYTVERLTVEKKNKAEEREKYEKELEQIEESWRSESKELLEVITRLEDENRRLRTVITETEGTTHNNRKEEEECQMIVSRLQDTVNSQHDQIRSHQRELAQKNVDLEAMQSQLERLAKLNADFRRKTSLSQRQTANLIQEKADLQMQLTDKEQQIAQIKERLKQESPDSPTAQVKDVEQQFEDGLSLEGKMIIDMKDPNRPRFTLNELREVLQERNELKTKLIEVEEELDLYKPGSRNDYIDLPVHGPINKEPDEKLYPGRRPDTGIRRFFQFFFGDSNKPGTTVPRKDSKPYRASPSATERTKMPTFPMAVPYTPDQSKSNLT